MAGKLGEQSIHLPFYVGAVSVMAGVSVLLSGRAYLRGVDREDDPAGSRAEAEAVTVGAGGTLSPHVRGYCCQITVRAAESPHVPGSGQGGCRAVQSLRAAAGQRWAPEPLEASSSSWL